MPKILIVDDDRTTVKLLQTLLEMDGFEVVTAANGQMALETAAMQHRRMCFWWIITCPIWTGSNWSVTCGPIPDLPRLPLSWLRGWIKKMKR